MNATPRHKVFVSYHHACDQYYKELFCENLGNEFVDKSVEDGDIDVNVKIDTVRQKIRDEFIADATVTVVLVGQCTWQRKHVDWEIGSSLRHTKNNARCGLLGILLPSHYDYKGYTPRLNLIPPRLADNCNQVNAYGAIYKWPDPWSSRQVREWIHRAFQRRFSVHLDNTRPQFERNRSGWCGRGWSD